MEMKNFQKLVSQIKATGTCEEKIFLRNLVWDLSSYAGLVCAMNFEDEIEETTTVHQATTTRLNSQRCTLHDNLTQRCHRLNTLCDKYHLRHVFSCENNSEKLDLTGRRVTLFAFDIVREYGRND